MKFDMVADNLMCSICKQWVNPLEVEEHYKTCAGNPVKDNCEKCGKPLTDSCGACEDENNENKENKN